MAKGIKAASGAEKMKSQARYSWIKDYFLILSSMWLLFVAYIYIDGRTLPGFLRNTESLSYLLSYSSILVVILSARIEKVKKVVFAALFIVMSCAAMYGMQVLTESQEELGTYSMIYIMGCVLVAIVIGITIACKKLLQQPGIRRFTLAAKRSKS